MIQLTSEIDSMFRRYLRADTFGFGDAEVWEDRYRVRLKRKRNGNKEDVIVYHYAPLRDNLRLSNVLYAGVSLLEVESILEKVISAEEKFAFLLDEFHVGTIVDLPDYDRGNVELDALISINFLEKGVFYEDRLIRCAESLRVYIELYLIPFFDQLDSIEAVRAKVIDRVAQLKLAHYVPGRLLPFRKQVILWLSKSPQYDEHVAWLGGVLKAYVETDPDNYETTYSYYIALTEFLNNRK